MKDLLKVMNEYNVASFLNVRWFLVDEYCWNVMLMLVNDKADFQVLGYKAYML